MKLFAHCLDTKIHLCPKGPKKPSKFLIHPMKGLVPVNGNGQEGIFNEHGFGEEAAWQAEAEEH